MFDILDKYLLSEPEKRNCKIHGDWINKYTFNVKCLHCEEEKRYLLAKKEKDEEHIFNQLKKEYRMFANLINANISNKHSGCNFNNYIVDGNNRYIYDRVREFAFREGNVNNEAKSLALMGKSGTGKTHLAIAALKYIIQKYGMNGYYIKQYNILNHHQQDRSLKKLQECGLLIIDEIGTIDIAYGNDILYQIIDGRYDNCLPSILISNLTDEEFKKRSHSALNSRLQETSTTVQCNNCDYRKHGKEFPMPINFKEMQNNLLKNSNETIRKKMEKFVNNFKDKQYEL